jgi:hypothetical protein
MTRGRLLVAGLTAAAAMTAADAFAQNCPEWLTLTCPSEALTVPAEEGVAQGQGEQPPRTRATAASRTGPQTRPARPAAANPASNPGPQQAQTPPPARQARTARPAMNAQEREALFQQFLVWREERRQSAAPSR